MASPTTVELGVAVVIHSIHDIDTTKETAHVYYCSHLFVKAASQQEGFRKLTKIAASFYHVAFTDYSPVKAGIPYEKDDGLAAGCFGMEFEWDIDVN